MNNYKGDLISRSKLKDKLKINFSRKPEAQEIYQHLIDIVDDCPTEHGIEERTQGEWVFQYENYQGDVYMCNNCCQEVFFLHNIKPDFKYCPYCNADMRQEEEA